MIVDLIDKLIDRVIQLVKEHKEAQKNLFENFVEPAYSLLQSVHEDYLKSFTAYRTAIDTAPYFSSVVDGLCTTIKKDNLFTEHHRAKLRALREVIGKVTHDESLREFVGAIWFYLYEGVAFVLGTEGTGDDVNEAIAAQIYRNGLFNALREIAAKANLSEEERKREALEELDEIVLGMQSKESYVTRLYMELKPQYLK
jgi:hypothetical protein